MHAKLLDCTLRDGAYLIDKKFGDPVIHGIINGLVAAKTDLIEIGFLQDEGMGEGKTVFHTSADAEKYIPAERGESLFTVLADYSRYTVSELDDYTGRSFDAVRECFFKHERQGAIEACRQIKKKGYLLFVQPVDILGYTDAELIEFIGQINEVEPYCLSIVDTFGSMYADDLDRVFTIIDHNLIRSCKIGFHSHNNLQMSSALSQEFLRISYGKREVVVDATISGMGRGAGNTPTELVMQYMVDKLGCSYDIDAVLDIIDNYMENIRTRCQWGYSTPFFIAGCYSAHVNNIAYLKQKNSIRSKDIRYILNKIGAVKRKRYDYDLLENTYVDYLHSEIDDSDSMERLGKAIGGRNVLILAPGRTIATCAEQIDEFIQREDPVVIAINFIPKGIGIDYLYLSNAKRYDYWRNQRVFKDVKKIMTSNLVQQSGADCVVSFHRLIKCGFAHVDNSALMLLRLLDQLSVRSVGIAGLYGYNSVNREANYASSEMELANSYESAAELNMEISNMLKDYMNTRDHQFPIRCITPSRFENDVKYVGGGVFSDLNIHAAAGKAVAA